MAVPGGPPASCRLSPLISKCLAKRRHSPPLGVLLALVPPFALDTPSRAGQNSMDLLFTCDPQFSIQLKRVFVRERSPEAGLLARRQHVQQLVASQTAILVGF